MIEIAAERAFIPLWYDIKYTYWWNKLHFKKSDCTIFIQTVCGYYEDARGNRSVGVSYRGVDPGGQGAAAAPQ